MASLETSLGPNAVYHCTVFTHKGPGRWKGDTLNDFITESCFLDHLSYVISNNKNLLQCTVAEEHRSSCNSPKTINNKTYNTFFSKPFNIVRLMRTFFFSFNSLICPSGELLA